MNYPYVELPPHVTQAITVCSIVSVCIVVALTTLFIVGRLKFQNRQPVEPKPEPLDKWLIVVAVGLCLSLLITGIAHRNDAQRIRVMEVRR